MSDIKIYGKLVNATTDNKLVGSDQTYDETQGKFQSEINKEVADKLGNGTAEINKKLAEVKSDLGSHKSNIDNPHGVTKTQVGLGNVTNDSQVKRSEMGTANGVATLDNQGLVPTSQLPSYVDDVIDVYATYTKDNAGILTNIKIFSDLDKTQAVTGESGKIYVDIESNYQFRWTGTQYVTVGAPTVLGEVTGTAYDGGKGKAVADKVNKHVAKTDNPHNVTKNQVGLGKVDNTADKDKPVSTAQSTAISSAKNEVQSNLDTHISDTSNPHNVTKDQVGLGNVDNTSDKLKPISDATKTALGSKVDKVTDKSLVLDTEIAKLSNLKTQDELNTSIADAKKAGTDAQTNITSHKNDEANPHNVTKDQVGLNQVDNTSDQDKPVSKATKIELDKKVDIVEGKGLSTEDFTSVEKTKLEGIAEGATRVIVDDTIKDSTNAVQNRAVKKTLDSLSSNLSIVEKDLNEKADNLVFTDSINGLVPKADTTAEKSTAVLTAEGKWMSSYDAAKIRTKRTFLAAPVNADGKADFRSITFEDLPSSIEDAILDTISYGISWKPNVSDPVVTRVGNMSYHKTLPIQNDMRGCIAQMKDGAKIMYFLDPTDWRWKDKEQASAGDAIIKNMKLTVTNDIYTLTDDIFSTLQYENQWLRFLGAGSSDSDIPARVISIDTSTNTATVEPDSPLIEEEYFVEFGAVLNGYDGEVMVFVPEFWIKSWDTDTRREVRIALQKIDDTWEYQPNILISPYRDTVLNTVPENMGYLSTLEVDSAISVVNINDYCRGGNNSSSYDAFMKTDRFRSMLGKPRTNIKRATMRANCRKSGKEILSYLQYKRVLYWLYFIEYANFNCQAEFKPELTSEGFRQGGLGNGVTTANASYWKYYNTYNPLTPNGYTNEFGNNTYIKAMTIVMPTTNTGDPAFSTTQYVPRWHGIENPFGDFGINVDGIIINNCSIVENGNKYSEVYATDDPTLYSDNNYKSMKRVGIEQCKEGYIKEWDLGSTAEIIPRISVGGPTLYKCDYHYFNVTSNILKTLILGGAAFNNDLAGLGFFGSDSNPNKAAAYIGFRSSCVLV